MLGNIGSVIVMTGWGEGTSLNDAQNGLIFRIAQDALDYYVSINRHQQISLAMHVSVVHLSTRQSIKEFEIPQTVGSPD
jgi:hypothetical protein